MRHGVIDTPHLGAVAESEKWRQLAVRRERNGIPIGELAERVGITREQLGKILRGEVPGSRALGRIERALDEVDQEAGIGTSGTSERPAGNGGNGGLVRFTIHGVYGAAEVVVEGPVENMPELQAAVDRLLRGQAPPPEEHPNR